MPKGRPNNKHKICDWCGQPFQLVASAQKRCEKCRIPARLELARRQSSAWYYNNPEKAKIRRQRAFEKHPGQYRETKRRYENRRRAQFRRIVIGFYTHGTYRCACCGEDEWDFLELDHINGGGRKENLRMFGRESSSPLYRWLARNGFPSGYQILCANCNRSKAKHAVCVHKRRVPAPYEKHLTLDSWLILQNPSAQEENRSIFFGAQPS